MTDWDATTYDRVSDPREEWGVEVLERLKLEGGETVLDAGCGTGRVTRLIAERLPRGRVIGIDADRSRVALGREQLADLGDRVELYEGDLLELELADAVDAVFSSAAFHWILNQQRLFGRLFAALRPGGRLEAQCGGEGNVGEWERAVEAAEGDERFSAYLRGIPATKYYPSVDDTETRLARAGFDVGAVWLEPRTVQPPDPRAYVGTVGLTRHLQRLPEALRGEFIGAVLGSMPRQLVLEYVRLNISARRPG